MEIKRLTVFISIFYLMLLSIVSAQQFNMPDWVRGAAAWWIILLVVGFSFMVIAMWRKSTKILSVGAIFLFASVILVVGSVLLPMFSQPTITYEKCTGLFKSDASLATAPGWFYATSCVLTGYSTPDLEWLTIITFFIFGIIAPITLMYYLFKDFMPTGMITDQNARTVISFIAALLAFRGFAATYFIDMLSYGFAGIGALIVGVLFTGFVYTAALRFCRPLGVDMKSEMRMFQLAEAEEVRREISDLEKNLSANPPNADAVRDRIRILSKRLDELIKGKL